MYLAIYLAIIPAFALVFTHTHNGFSQSTSTTGATLDASRRSLVAAIQADLDSRVPRPPAEPKGAGSDTTVGRAKLTDLALDARKSVQLELSVPFKASTSASTGGGRSSIGAGTAPLELDEVQNSKFQSEDTSSKLRSYYAFQVPTGAAIPGAPTARELATLEFLMPGAYGSTFEAPQSAVVFVPLSDPTHAKLNAFRTATAGNAPAVSSQFLRMLYFSATTITTVGLGDVVPATSAARAWVAIESLAAVLVAALFLIAVATRVSRRREERPAPSRSAPPRRTTPNPGP